MTTDASKTTGRAGWLGWLLGAAAVIQVGLVLNFYAVDWTKRVWRLRALPAEDRSAVYFLGHRAASFVDFIEAVTPEDASLVIPPDSEWLSSQSVLLFFLLPRSAIACQCERVSDPGLLSEACSQCLRSPETSVPAIGDFPPPQSVSDIKDFIPYAEDTGWFHGIYVPKGGAPAASVQAAERDYSPLRALASDLLLLGGFLLLGALLAQTILDPASWLEILSLGFPLGTGVWTWFVFLTSWGGIPLSTASILITFTLVSSAIFLISRALSRKRPLTRAEASPQKISENRGRFSPVAVIAALGILGLFLLSIGLAVGRAYSTFDAMTIWSLKGYGIAYDRTIFAYNRLGGHGLAYPLNISLAVSFFRLGSGDVLPGSKFLFPLFTGSLLLGCYRYWRRKGVENQVALPGVLLLLSVPLIFIHSTTGFVNLVFTTYLVLGVLWSIEGLFEERPRALLIGGLLFALAGWTRAEGTGFSIVMIAALLIARWIAGRKGRPPLGWLLPILLIPGSWSLIGTENIVGDEIGQVAQNFLRDLLNGQVDWNNVLLVFTFEIEQILKPEVWGVLFFLCGFLLLLGIRNVWPRAHPERFALFSALLVAVVVPIGMMVVASSTKTPFYGWLGVSMNRAMFPAVFLGTVLCVIAAAVPLSVAAQELEPPHTSSSPAPTADVAPRG